MTRLTRQDVFNYAWEHYIVEGRPYAAIWNFGFPTPIGETTEGLKSPAALVQNHHLNAHVTKTFLRELNTCHDDSMTFAFSGAVYNRIKNLYARRFQRLFRRTMKFYLINFAMKYGLSVDSEIAHTVHAKKVARKFKK